MDSSKPIESIKNNNKRGLGKGLSVLFGEHYPDNNVKDNPREYTTVENLPSNEIFPNKDQPRRQFDEVTIDELAKSIATHGILQPIIVHKLDANQYQIVAGERRYRAALQSGLDIIPCIVLRDLDERKKYELSLLENIQRQDLNPMEEARAYQTLIDKFLYKHEQLADIVHKSRSHVSNILRLLKLSDYISGLIIDGKLSVGHAKILLTTPDADKVAKIAVENNFSVRELESYLKPKLEASENNMLGGLASTNEPHFTGNSFKKLKKAIITTSMKRDREAFNESQKDNTDLKNESDKDISTVANLSSNTFSVEAENELSEMVGLLANCLPEANLSLTMKDDKISLSFQFSDIEDARDMINAILSYGK